MRDEGDEIVLELVELAQLVVLCGVLGYYYVSFARIIDARLHGERDTVFPRVLARPLEIRRGQSLTDRQLIDRLNDLGYAQRASIEKPGEFAIGRGAVTIKPRGAELKGLVRVVFQKPAAEVRTASRRPTPPKPPDHVERIDVRRGAPWRRPSLSPSRA